MKDVDKGGPTSRGTCAHCRNAILGEVIQALGNTYHPEHFVCGNCQNPLGTSNFYEQDEKPHCEKCYQELFCARCAHCDEPILDRCVTALNKKWHVHHFICTQCLGPFEGGTFFEKEGRPYCENCFYGAFASRCASCNQPIRGECINALGQQWHPEHFVCQYCQKSFAGGSFYEHGGKPYCEVHYHQQTGSLCSGCGKAITGRCVNALDKKWHPEHFVCAFCMNPLAGGSFTENNGKAYCKECHGKLFG
jgi:paxillin